MNTTFLNNLFRYYDMSLKIENVLGLSYKENDISRYNLINNIHEAYKNSLITSQYFNLGNDLKNNYTPIDFINHNSINNFFEKISILEKAFNLDGTRLKKNLDPISILEHKNFIFSNENNQYQYGIVYNLISDNPYGFGNKLVPCFVLLFPVVDREFNLLSPEDIFIKIKEYLEHTLTDSEQQRALSIDISPYLIFNSKLLEPYNLETPEIKITSHLETKNAIKSYLGKIVDSKIFKDNEIARKFKQEDFIVGIPQNLNMGLTKIYNSIFEYKNINNLLRKYFSVHSRKETEFSSIEINNNEIIDSSKIIKSYSNHFGSFDKDFPLADTQRDAFTCYLENGEVLPINGAPGTGKTSLLRGIFGDYTVKAAIKTYKNYLQNNTILFTTPIVCSSTNNQALSNVSEGIESGFQKVVKDNLKTNLYNRWLDKIEVSKKSIDFANTLFVPSIKGKKQTHFELTKNDISSFCNIVAKNPIKFLNEYFKYRGNEICYEKPNKRTLDDLKDAAQFFFDKIINNIKKIESLQNHIKEEVENLAQVEIKLINKYTNKGIQEELIKATFEFIRKQLTESWIVVDEFERYYKELSDFENQKNKTIDELNIKKKKILSLEDEIVNKTNKIQVISRDIDREKSYLNSFKKSPSYNELFELTKNKYKLDFEKEREKVNENVKFYISKIRKESSLVDKISFGLFGKGKIKDLVDELNEKAKEELMYLNKTFWEQDFFLEDLDKSINLCHEDKISVLEKEFLKVEENLTNLTSELSLSKLNEKELEDKINEIDYNKRSVEFKLDEKFDILSDDIFDIEDLKELLKYKDVYNNLKSLKSRNEDFDKNIRTDNFYFALHLLEAMFFISNFDKWNNDITISKFSNKSIVCPVCKKSVLSHTKEKEIFQCVDESCKATYSFNNLNNPTELSLNEVQLIIKQEKALINDKFYRIKINNKFINIVEGKENNFGGFSFNSIYPIFPLINITCNSFGTIASDKGSKEVRENIFEFLLIDEAGTIPASKMIILNCAKRVMFFGDTKQLKPIFAYDSKIENRILEDFIPSKNDINYINTFFSCAAKDKQESTLRKNNNAMHIANSCCNYFLPYNKSKMEGDIWLKEHFRCQTPIVNISNEISYYNEIIPCKKEHKNRTWDILQFVEHEHLKTDSNVNEGEITEIINFLEKYQYAYIEKFLKVIKTKNDKITGFSIQDFYSSIGIITPFSNQENLLKKRLIEKFGHLENNPYEPVIKVGTVHKFQGSERETIIFSSVYNKESVGKTANLFFNREDPDMINVAVTRAKEIFILFGNKIVLNDKDTYSGIMVNHIEEFQRKKHNS